MNKRFKFYFVTMTSRWPLTTWITIGNKTINIDDTWEKILSLLRKVCENLSLLFSIRHLFARNGMKVYFSLFSNSSERHVLLKNFNPSRQRDYFVLCALIMYKKAIHLTYYLNEMNRKCVVFISFDIFSIFCWSILIKFLQILSPIQEFYMKSIKYLITRGFL